MKRVALAVASAATAAVALLPGAVAQAAAPGAYTVSRIVLSSKVLGIAVDSSTGLVYVGGYATVHGQGTVTVIDGASQAVKGSITVPGLPTAIAVDPATDTVYAATASGLTVINGETNTVITTIASVGRQVAVDPATDTVYSAKGPASNVPVVAVINGATNSITATVSLGSTTSYVNSLAVDTATDTVYAGTIGGTLFAIDGATDAVTKSVQLSTRGNITGLAVDSTTSSVYAVDSQTNTVDVVNAATLADTASITGCPDHIFGAAADPTANAIYVTSYGTVSPSPADSACVIDAATNTVAETFPRGGMAVAADPATGAAYIAAWYPSNAIWVATPSATNELSPVVYGFNGGFGSPSATFAVGVASSFPLKVSAVPAATITETGALPTGVTMSSSGVFSGKPAAGTVGTYPITVSASNGVSPNSTVSLDIVVDTVNQPPAIDAASRLTFRAGRHVRYRIAATGFPAPVLREHGLLPRGLAFRAGANGTALIVGKPAWSDKGKRYRITITASNHIGRTATERVTIRIR